jgi:very-short-patch-repair endonuclease
MKVEPKIFINYIMKVTSIELVSEHKFHKTRKWRFDYASVKHKVAIEVDGGIWVNGRHSRGSGQIKDMEKFNEAAIYGWRILKVQPADLMKLSTAKMLSDCCVNDINYDELF